MPIATITAKYVNPPKDGKKFGSIVDSDGNRYPASGAHLAKIQKGETFTIEYKEEKWGDSPVMVVTAIHQEERRPQSNGHAPTTNASAAREIFITGIVGRSMGSGQFQPTDIRILTLAAAQAWDALHQPAPQQHEEPPPPQPPGNGYGARRGPLPPHDLDDEIPF